MELETRSARTARSGGWASVYAVGLSTFSVVTTEMLPVGLMTAIAMELETSVGTAGLMLSVPAILAALFAPFVILVAGNIDRRRILAGLLVLLVAANIASALAPSIGLLLAARVVVGFCMGGIWAIAGGLAPRLVPAHSVGTATAIIFGGVAAASVLGVPVGAVIGDIAGWRSAFGAMALFSLFVLVLNLVALPALPIRQSVGLGHFKVQLARPAVQSGLIITLLIVAGHFMAYTFVSPILQSISGVRVEWIGVLLFLYGAAGIAGNFLAGMAVSRRLPATLVSIAIGLVVAILGFRFLGTTAFSGAALLLVWGVAYGGVSVSLQSWMMKAAPSALEIATALFVAAFNIGIAAGSFAGGLVVDRFDLPTTLLLAALMPATALLFFIVIPRR
ncbi:MFS transporter [Rhizobium sp. RM]|uniref:MFS transporter n=1 Tax=Rhizobium sp. RM TaxID=2748079 RepID=UPI00110D9F16|nr:MFS transporter [Rhizobium sp. RM]NWJ26137.1 MFS transporter [Rhizobium sp. RM]TMV20731.1 MFS transporter [Rhizobium sp. Td3]